MKEPDDSALAPFSTSSAYRRKLNFDPTINAGHILTFLGMMFALFAGWTSLDKRVVTLERDSVHQQKIDNAQDATIKEKFDDIKTIVRDVQASINEIRRQGSGSK